MNIDHQVVTQQCDCCHADYTVSRGSAYEDGQRAGIYLAALHHCKGDKLALLAIAISGDDVRSVTMKVWPTATKFEMYIIEPSESPWQSEAYLGHIMGRAEALASPMLASFFHIADHVVADNLEVNAYLSGGDNAQPDASANGAPRRR